MQIHTGTPHSLFLLALGAAGLVLLMMPLLMVMMIDDDNDGIVR